MSSPIWRAGLILVLLGGCFASEAENKTYRGEIADSQCSLNVHSLTRSHQEMLKSKSMGGSSSSCTLYCIKYLGGDFVLASEGNVYRLDEQGDRVRNLSGLKVKITGTLDSKTKTIHVVAIEPDEK